MLERERLLVRDFLVEQHFERPQTSVTLAGKTWYRRHFSSRFCKNVVASKQVKNTVAVLAFFDLQKGLVTSSKNI
mgnify:FL=1